MSSTKSLTTSRTGHVVAQHQHAVLRVRGERRAVAVEHVQQRRQRHLVQPPPPTPRRTARSARSAAPRTRRRTDRGAAARPARSPARPAPGSLDRLAPDRPEQLGVLVRARPSTSSNARCATLTLRDLAEQDQPRLAQERVARAARLQPRAQRGRGQRAVAGQPAPHRRVQDRQRELEVMALAGRRRRPACGSTAAAASARRARRGSRIRPRAMSPAYSVWIRCVPLPRVHRARARAGSTRASRRPRPASPADRHRAARLGRVAARGRRPRTRRGPWRRRSTGARAARPRAPAGRGRCSSAAGRPCSSCRASDDQRRGDLADQPGGRRRVDAERAARRPRRPRRRRAAAIGTPSRVARSDAGSTRACPSTAAAPCSAASSRRARASTRRPSTGCSSSSNSSSVSSLAISSRFARSQRHAGRATRHGGSGAPNDWNTLRSRTAYTSRPHSALTITALRCAPSPRSGAPTPCVCSSRVLHEQRRGRAVGHPQPVVELDHRAPGGVARQQVRRAPASARARSRWRGSTTSASCVKSTSWSSWWKCSRWRPSTPRSSQRAA